MRLDIAIKAPGTLRVDNNLASLVAKGDLTLTGSPTEPQVLGRVEVERGKVFFGDNTYHVRKGVANFSNPREINPVFDIEASLGADAANGGSDRRHRRPTQEIEARVASEDDDWSLLVGRFHPEEADIATF